MFIGTCMFYFPFTCEKRETKNWINIIHMLTNLFSTCHNRVQQQPIKVKLQVFKTEKRGWGIRALHDIPQVKHNIYLILRELLSRIFIFYFGIRVTKSFLFFLRQSSDFIFWQTRFSCKFQGFPKVFPVHFKLG